MGSQSKRTGALGEQIAARYLIKKGYRIVATNYCIQGGEIDLIAQKDGILVFVEVKSRRRDYFGDPREALNKRKKRNLLRAIRHFLQTHTANTWRCDLIAIQIRQQDAYIQHFTHIFEDA